MVAALLLGLILLVTGLGLMSAQASRYGAAARLPEALQAKNAALSGLEDARVKLAKDVKFPPRKSKDRGQTKFAYSENLFDDPASGEPPVSYSVVIDYALEQECQVANRWEPYRWGVYRIAVSGYLGPRNEPIAQSLIYAEYDINTGQLIRFEDRGSL